jgi:hypothetical protein
MAAAPNLPGVNLSAAAGNSGDPTAVRTALVAYRRPAAMAMLPQITPRRPYQPTISCMCGTVNASLLNASSTNQEVPILLGGGGGFRFEHVMIQEATQFVSASVASLSVAAGRPGNGGELIPPFALKSAASPGNFWFDRPAPPQIAGSYDIVLSFTGSSALGDGNTSKFPAGALNWEICGYNVQ